MPRKSGKLCPKCGKDTYDEWLTRGGVELLPAHVELTSEDIGRLFEAVKKIPKKARKRR